MPIPRMEKIIPVLKREVKKFHTPIVEVVAAKGHDPFCILISTMLSLRTKDATTAAASKRLFRVADTPRKIVALSHSRIEKLIYPVGFYHTKARSMKKTAQVLLEKYRGKVPDTIEKLVELPGVGRKTANLVVSLGFGKDGICVDTHVHRISNRLGYVRTKTPHETEFALRKKLPRKYWQDINVLLVTWGQNVCAPISPRCSVCAIRPWCKRVGVGKSR
ncbi:MAG: endonuclease III [Candidatus Kerfeldbacteria bacterium RIFCSPLOWO2_01_FULL_48_11]|uniref:Endonuclease III n=1 Tax=Candidatus Kerfeldbacteria bacterium RIFCSPLOWO2_01_FULL_48_11 TaxID=1798543 RepID=A0A1G2B1D0_9BACT|nr:MAG: endonuclease III [Candidatus Kerfeldbacteria bacterium RIFCSPLOWO2_01_FULL_48_11]